jgi:transcriptional regulator with XRE-family HTH domain
MTEAEKAKAWRQARGFKLQELADLTGFAVSSIKSFEAGKQANGEPITPEAMLRYRLCCAAVHHGHHKHFGWE